MRIKIPSQRAARMIERVRIGPAAPGLRPVASAALPPRIPMPSAAPIAANAIAANLLITILFIILFVVVFQNPPRSQCYESDS